MHESGSILLVACYEMGHQPLAVAWPAAALERAGYRPALLDVSIEPFDPAMAARAQVAAISVPMHTALRIGLGVVARIRAASPGCHVCFFGLYAELNADHLLANGADSIIAGEVETPLVGLVDALAAGGDWRGAPGVTSSTRRAAPHLQRGALPVPSRGALPVLGRYVQLERDGRRVPAGHTEATRGCLHLCRHCPIPPVYRGRFFAVPLDVCLADIRQQVAQGARHITFGDPDFLNGPTHALRVARALHDEFPEISFDFTAKIEHLLRHRALLPEFGRLGCLFIVSAVESLAEAVLDHLDKGHSRADVEAALRAIREAGIAPRPTWVAFTPWTSLDDYREMLDFVEAEDLVDHVDPVQWAIRLLVPPGSLLLEGAAMRPYLGALVEAELSYRWTHPDPRMEALHGTVTARVTAAVERGEDAAITFAAVRDLAEAMAGQPASPLRGLPAADRKRPPRLTEPWFC